MSHDPRLNEQATPIWKMSPVEKLSEGLRRRAVLMKYLVESGVKVRADGPTLIVETSLNNYFIDFADDDPRFITVQTIYELSDIEDSAILAASEATAHSFGAKAILSQHGSAFRLRFVAEITASNLSAFTGSIGLYQAQIEDCRERFLSLVASNRS